MRSAQQFLKRRRFLCVSGKLLSHALHFLTKARKLCVQGFKFRSGSGYLALQRCQRACGVFILPFGLPACVLKPGLLLFQLFQTCGCVAAGFFLVFRLFAQSRELCVHGRKLHLQLRAPLKQGAHLFLQGVLL